MIVKNGHDTAILHHVLCPRSSHVILVMIEHQKWISVVNCEDLLHTFTTKICTHNKTRLEMELRCSCSLTSKVVRGK